MSARYDDALYENFRPETLCAVRKLYDISQLNKLFMLSGELC